MLAATAPVSAAGTVLVSYSRAKRDVDCGPFDVGTLKGGQSVVGYNHALSKRTNVYATYAQSGANDFAEGIGYYHVGPVPMASSPAISARASTSASATISERGRKLLGGRFGARCSFTASATWPIEGATLRQNNMNSAADTQKPSQTCGGQVRLRTIHPSFSNER